MKKWFMIGMTAMLTCFLSACGAEATVPTQDVDYSMTFANQTGRNVSRLEIRPSEEAEWSEITLTENEWKNSFEMPVSMQGQIPVAEDGWQVQMTFASDDMAVWDGIVFADAQTITFSVDENGETAVMVEAEEAEEAITDCNPADIPIEDGAAADTVSESAEECGLSE